MYVFWQIFILALALIACSKLSDDNSQVNESAELSNQDNPKPIDELPQQDEMNALYMQIKALTSDLGCGANSSCKAKGMVHSACGGFAKQIIYSTERVDQAHLHGLMDQYTFLRFKHRNTSDSTDSCEYAPVPLSYELLCEDNRCVYKPDHDTVPALSAEIASLTSDVTCSSDLSCKAKPMGAAACGGPTSYVIYSTDRTDELLLNQKITLYNQYMEERNRADEVVGTCQVLAVPTSEQVFCIEQKCALDSKQFK